MENTTSPKQLWESALVEIGTSISKANFQTWFKDTNVSRLEDGVAYLAVPNAFVRDWISDKYHKMALHALRNLSEQIRSIEYVITKDEQKRAPARIAEWTHDSGNTELPLKEHYTNKENNLNPRYTFDSFVVGPFNELAHAAAQAIIKKPAVYNPLFFYGNTGHGKTHLVQAVGNFLYKTEPLKKAFYITSEKFQIEFVVAMQANRINQFKEKYRIYDLFIMDDIQFLSGKWKTQEELFHLFNTLYESNKQIIFSADVHPNFISDIQDRLKSRFASGMVVDLPAPDFESRIAILQSKAKHSGFPISMETAQYLAGIIEGNIRELEGLLNAIICSSQLKGRELNLSEVKSIVKANEKPKKMISIKDVLRVISNFYQIEESSIYEKTRRKEVVRPRQIAMFLLREDCSISYPLIGQKLGGRDHTTVIHSYEKIKNELKHNSTLEQEIKQLRAML
ncbi:MAG: chromosomal replication initiator protein [Parcubacteria group bacterium Gr01-1014_17]|nr:MAG: chromosomal replication initiator protein [Parcubacteria group bacterium Gr01-1014_17]